MDRIHGELLKLGFDVAQSSAAKYMVKRCGPPGQGWRTFLQNHAPDIAAMDLFVVPTIGFDQSGHPVSGCAEQIVWALRRVFSLSLLAAEIGFRFLWSIPAVHLGQYLDRAYFVRRFDVPQI